jgi:hypothetical protein
MTTPVSTYPTPLFTLPPGLDVIITEQQELINKTIEEAYEKLSQSLADELAEYLKNLILGNIPYIAKPSPLAICATVTENTDNMCLAISDEVTDQLESPKVLLPLLGAIALVPVMITIFKCARFNPLFCPKKPTREQENPVELQVETGVRTNMRYYFWLTELAIGILAINQALFFFIAGAGVDKASKWSDEKMCEGFSGTVNATCISETTHGVDALWAFASLQFNKWLSGIST